MADNPSSQQTRPVDSSPPLTGAEKDWLKQHWGGEFHFLRAYGLSIHKDEDREEGCAIVRAMMAHDAQQQ